MVTSAGDSTEKMADLNHWWIGWGLGGGVCMHILVCEKDKMKDTHGDI